MSIRATFLAVFLVLLALLAGIGTSALVTARAQSTVTARERQRFESWKLADELRQSSDDLTRMARTFVVTGDPRYETYFQRILAIRNGDAPRPEGYEGIYWDFVVAGQRSLDAGGGERIALEQRMRDMGFTAQELAKLEVAKQRSDALVSLEETAMHAIKGLFADDSGAFTVERAPDPETARRIMHGPEYHEAKARIMEPIAEFTELLDARTAREAAAAQARAGRYARTTLWLTIATIIIALGAFLLLYLRIVGPVRAMVDRLRDVAEGDGDLTRRVDETGGAELGELARWFNRFVGVVHEIVKRASTTATSTASAAAEIAATARQQSKTVADLGGSTSQIAAAVREISATGDQLVSTMHEVARAAGESAAVADAGRAGLREMESTMTALTESSRSVSAKLASLDERTGGIGRIITTIVRVADQTDVLSVNAAIEAEKAGAAGAGFHVVAREIRHLADQTAEATLEIESDVRQMQAAAAEGVSQMGRYSELVHGAETTVGRLSGQLGQIIERTQTLSGRFEEVSGGMAEQATGVAHINEAMVSLSSAAGQATAALAEFTDAAEHLRESTASLRSEIGRFRLNGA